MKKIFIIFSCLCPISFAFAADQWDEQHVWSYHALADTLENVYNQCNADTTDMLVQLSDFVNANNAEVSVRQLVDKCVEISGSGACDVVDNAGIAAWTETLSNQDNEFCDVFVSNFVQSQNSYVGVYNVDGVMMETGYGCPPHRAASNDDIIFSSVTSCERVFGNNSAQLARCTNCVGNAGSYELDKIDNKYKCYIEVIAWYCTGQGKWLEHDAGHANPINCAKDNKYNGCRIVRKYVDAEKPFTCDAGNFVPAETITLSGCAQHGCSGDDKHPPLYIYGDKNQDCKTPLYQNTQWRFVKNAGTRAGFRYRGTKHNSTDWCMLNAIDGPWNKHNNDDTGHFCAGRPRLEGGQSIPRWFKL